MERKIIYGAGRPHFESRTVVFLNSFCRLLFLTVKFFIFVFKTPFDGGIDNKTVTKEYKE